VTLRNPGGPSRLLGLPRRHEKPTELCSAIRQVMLGLADDLGGGVFKKRLKKNQYRSIIVARAGQFWVYEFLFAEQD
jgi:hypothetical protein